MPCSAATECDRRVPARRRRIARRGLTRRPSGHRRELRPQSAARRVASPQHGRRRRRRQHAPIPSKLPLPRRVVGLWSAVCVKALPHFEPGTTHLHSVDTTGTLRLDRYGVALWVMGSDPYANDGMTHSYGTTWRPESVALEVNGRQVLTLRFHDGREYGPGDTLDLRYPAPAPDFTPPRLDR